MSVITCDMREGRTDAQKQALAAGLIAAVRAATGEPISEMFMVIREGLGINFIEAGEHLPDFTKDNAADTGLVESLRRQC